MGTTTLREKVQRHHINDMAPNGAGCVSDGIDRSKAAELLIDRPHV